MLRTRHTLSAAILITALGLLACRPAIEAPEPEPVQVPASTANSAVQAKPVVALDPEGLRLVDGQTGSSRLLAFGTAAEQVHETIATLDDGAGVQQGTNPECGAGPLDYRQWEVLTLLFQNDQFVGWAANRPGLTTMDGLGVGTPRTLLESSRMVQIQETSLGTEFQAGELFGVISESGLVSNLWAGVSCNFR